MEIVSFVILHYKDLTTTDACVQSILKMDQRDRIRIVIVDNDIGESEEHRNKIIEKYKENPEIEILQIKENGGFSYANNQGYLYAKEQQKASFILVLNNDIEFVQQDFLEKLDNLYQQELCHIIGPDVIRQSTGEHQNPLDERLRTREEAEFTIKMNRKALAHYGMFFPVLYWKNKIEEKKKIRKNHANAAYYGKVHRDIVPFGACLIFTPLFVEKENKAFEPETSFYYEEYILACRCKKKNYHTFYTPELRVLHESGVATRKSMENERKRMKFVMEKVADSCEKYLQYLNE